MTRPLSYLAVPYSHEDPRVRERRFRCANAAAGWLMRKGMHVFSPISHTHPISVDGNLPGHFDYWERFDRAYLSCSHELYVLTLDGWKESKGVRAEIQIARGMDLPIRVIGPTEDFREIPNEFVILHDALSESLIASLFVPPVPAVRMEAR